MRIQLIAYRIEDESITPITPTFKPPKTYKFRTDSKDMDPEKLSLLPSIQRPNKYYIYLEDARGYRDHSFTVQWNIDRELIPHKEIQPTSHISRDFLENVKEIPIQFEDMVHVIQKRKPLTLNITAEGGRGIGK